MTNARFKFPILNVNLAILLAAIAKTEKNFTRIKDTKYRKKDIELK